MAEKLVKVEIQINWGEQEVTMPEWATHIAQDNDGSWWAYELPPVFQNGAWRRWSGRVERLGVTELLPIPIKYRMGLAHDVEE